MTDVSSGVDVDGRHCLGLVYDQVTSGLQRDLAIQRLVDLLLDTMQIEDRARPLIELDASRRIGHERFGECEHVCVLARRVDQHAAHAA